jgi:hypothetical protein
VIVVGAAVLIGRDYGLEPVRRKLTNVV